MKLEAGLVRSFPFVFLAVVMCLCSQASAQTLGTEAGEEQSLKIKTTGTFTAPREIGGTGAKATTSSAQVEAVYESDNVSVALTYEAVNYSWEHTGRLPYGGRGGAPWEVLHHVGIDLGYHGGFTDSWGYFAGVAGGLSFEQEIGDAQSLAAYGGLTYAFSDEWVASLGGGVSYNYVETTFFPAAGLTYTSKSIKGLNAELRFPYASASYAFNEYFGVRVFGNYDYALYKLRDDSPVYRGGFLENKGYRAGAYLDFTPLKDAQFSLGCEYNFAGEQALYRSSGSLIDRYELGGAVGGRAQIKLSF